MDIQKITGVIKVIIAAVAFVFLIAVANYLMSDETRPIQKEVPYQSPILQQQKFYSITLNKCDEPCFNVYGFSIPYITQTKPIRFEDIVTIHIEKEDSLHRSNYILCDINNTCSPNQKILNIEKTEYYKNIQVGFEIKYRKEPNGFETKKGWEWLLNYVIGEI